MRKIIYLFLFPLIVLSCSSDNDEINASSINPPEWIQGTWLVQGSTTGDNGVRFTSNDLILIQVFTETSQRELIENSRELGQEIEVIENISEEHYSLHLDFNNAPTVNLRFSKLSSSEITWNQVANSILVKQ
ncbi:hypothetical protein [Salegentibacter maritimus]|uniref:Lipocalin-like domain-containing protein n=1 Tax=Salegentibacter maritimus TaxID=2794347 RepID=A0ABS0TMC1_9FLAO|nr:hypothetical protein [Salegentibacter maritimus]MBI6121179.1 hypothetical protein [Salegentibacter maritimus]